MLQSFNNTYISIMKGDVFADKGNLDFSGRIFPCVAHIFPLFKVRLRAIKVKTLTYNLGKMFFFHGKRSFIKDVHIKVLKNV